MIKKSVALNLLVIGLLSFSSACSVNTRNIASNNNTKLIETASQFALVLSPTKDRMELFDIRTNRSNFAVSTGRSPMQLAVAPDKKNILVINRVDGTVSSFFREDNSRIQSTGTVGTGQNPTDVLFNNSGNEAIVSFAGTQKLSIFKILNRDRPQLLQNILLRDESNKDYTPYKAVFSADDQKIFVVDKVNRRLFSYKKGEKDFVFDKSLEIKMSEKSFSPEFLYSFENKLYISDSLNSSIVVFDTNESKFTADISLKNNEITSDTIPLNLVVNKDSGKLYVINQGSSSVAVVDLKENKLLKHIKLSTGSKNDSSEPSDISLSMDKSFIYVTNNIGRNLSIISTKDDSLLRNIGTTQSGGALPPLSAIELL